MMLLNIIDLEDFAKYRCSRDGTIIRRQKTISFKIGAMLACNQESRRFPVNYDRTILCEIICRAGGYNSLAAS